MTDLDFQAHSLLGIEIGSVNTRAVLFDVVDESYHFIASGVVPSSHSGPDHGVGEAVFQAITKLQDITGRLLFDQDDNLIIPSQAGSEGVDYLVVSVSCGTPVNMVTFGLLGDVSLESVNKLTNIVNGKLVESIGVNDRRSPEVQLDAVVAAKPDLLIFSGGTDGGARRSVLRMSQLITSILEIIPRSQRPAILMCGNSELATQLGDHFGKFTAVQITRNIRPSIDIENLDPAINELGKMLVQRMFTTVGGLKDLSLMCDLPPELSQVSLHRVVKFLGRQYDPEKGVLGIDLGASSTSFAYANDRTSSLATFPYGVGAGLTNVLERSKVADISRWLDGSIPDEEVWDYLWQKSIFPSSLAVSVADLKIELAAARQILNLIMKDLQSRNALPANQFEPILVSGSVLTRTPHPQQALLAILDGLQPLGICPIILDKHGILPILGSAGKVIPLLPVQVLESSAFTNLATVVSAVSNAKEGVELLEARLEYSEGDFIETKVKQGSIVSLPLASGDSGTLRLKMLKKTTIEDVDLAGEPVKVNGGVCGVVIDARGRPLKVPEDLVERAELFKSWEFMLGTK